MVVHITRHGQVLPAGPESWSDADYPPGDMPLSARGREQASLLGQRLRHMDFTGPIYTSTPNTCPNLTSPQTTRVVPKSSSPRL